MKTLLHVKTDPEVKANAKKAAKELGVPLSVIVNAYLKQFVRSKEVYLSVVPQMSPALEKLVGRVEKDIANRRHLSPTISSRGELNDYLAKL